MHSLSSSISTKKIHAWFFTGAMGMLLILIGLLNYINSGSITANLNFQQLFREAWLIYIQLLVMLYFLYYSMRLFDRYFYQKKFIPRLITEVAFVTFFGYFLNRLFLYFFIKWIVVPEPDASALQGKLLRLLLVIQTLMTVMYALVATARLLGRLQEKTNENNILENSIAMARFEALKSQLNPHFLFSSLNVLSSLVYENPQKAELFIEQLSKTYRYILENKKNEAVLLSTELSNLEQYIYIYEQRYGIKVNINVQVREAGPDRFVLPQCLLVILEYITGVNKMSATKPLSIFISNNVDFLLVSYEPHEKSMIAPFLQDQFEALKRNYKDAGFPITIMKDEISNTLTLKIPFLKGNG